MSDKKRIDEGSPAPESPVKPSKPTNDKVNNGAIPPTLKKKPPKPQKNKGN